MKEYEFCVNFYTHVRNTKQNETATKANELYSQIKVISTLPDDASLADVDVPGWYNVYTTIDGLKYRWFVNIEVVTGGAIGNVYWRRQTAYHYMGGPYNTPPRQRNIYGPTGDTWGYTPWFKLFV